MIIVKKTSILIEKLKIFNQTIGFVPTMGALHKGHISLINQSRKDCAVSVCSIFVNPAQFNDINDFEKYPNTISQDIFLLEQAGCDILFLPSVDEIYPNGLSETNEHYNLGSLENVLEGKYRPGHFQGVCKVISRLINIVKPTHLFLGQKDYQQCLIIIKLLQLINQQKNIQIIICETLRESNGLAMSSRNMRLLENQKQQASAIYESLQFISEKIKVIDILTLKKQVANNLYKAGFEKIDYVSIAEKTNLEEASVYEENKNYISSIAAIIGGVRLIDNMPIQ